MTVVLGHLAWNPELRNGPTGRPWARIALVTTDGDHCEAMCFANLARQVSEMRAGTEVVVEVTGQTRSRSWTGADSRRRNTTQYVAQSLQVLAEPSAEGALLRVSTADGVDVLEL